jgi:hypothetical protein
MKAVNYFFGQVLLKPAGKVDIGKNGINIF